MLTYSHFPRVVLVRHVIGGHRRWEVPIVTPRIRRARGVCQLVNTQRHASVEVTALGLYTLYIYSAIPAKWATYLFTDEHIYKNNTLICIVGCGIKYSRYCPLIITDYNINMYVVFIEV